MNKKLTSWFPMSVNPVRRGRYMVQTESETGGWWVDGLWDGKAWHALVTLPYCDCPYKAKFNRVLKRWRGITFDRYTSLKAKGKQA